MIEDRDREVELSELLKEVRRIEVQSKRLVTGIMAGSYNSVFRGSGIEFDEVREYIPGDDPRSVDWNVTARVGKPYIKRYVEERDRTVLFLLDLSASMTGGFGYWSARQMAARVCACMGLSAIANNDRVGLIAFSKEVDRFVPPEKGAAHALRIVRDCLALPGSDAHTDLATAIRYAARAVRRQSVLFVVSDFLSTGWRQAMTLCARRHDVTAVRLWTPELAPPAAGLLRVRDPESGRERTVDFGDRRVRDAYAERVAQWDRRTRKDLLRAQVDLMDVPLPRERDRDAIVRPILKFFRMRTQRAAKR